MTDARSRAVHAVAHQRRISDLGMLDSRPCWVELDPARGDARLTGWPNLPAGVPAAACE